MQLQVRNTIAILVYLARIEHGAVSKISNCQFTETYRTHQTKYHNEKNDREQNTNTMPGLKRKKMHNYRQWLERFKQNTEKRDRYWATNQRGGNGRNQEMGNKRRKDTTSFYGH